MIGEIGSQVADIARTHGELDGLKAARAAHPNMSVEDLKKTPQYQDTQNKYGTGSDFQRGIQAATAGLQGLAGGNIAGALAGASAPELAHIMGHESGLSSDAALVAHAILGGLAATLQGNSAAAGAAGAVSGELAAKAIAARLYPHAKEMSDLTEEEKQTVSMLATMSAGLAGGLAGDSTVSAGTGAQAGKNAAENNYLSNQQRSERDKEFDACKGNTSCQLKVGAKWDAIDIGQEAAYGAGMLVGVPKGISDSVEGLSKVVTNPAATYDAIKQLITSDDMFSTMSDAVKQSYIDHINRMESEYQRAGAGGVYNAGHEAGKLVSDLITAVAGGVGVAKTGGVLTEKIVAKITSKAGKALPETPSMTWGVGDGEFSPKPGKSTTNAEYPGGSMTEIHCFTKLT